METEDTDVPVFQLKHDSLGNRCNDVFGCLDALEKKHQDFEETRSVEDASEDRRLLQHYPSVEELGGTSEESTTFKKPEFSGRDYQHNNKGGRHGHERTSKNNEFKVPRPMSPSNRGGPSRGRGRHSRVSDYNIHPDRWTEYSLEDVDTSDSANKQAAFAFLEERRAMREAEIKDDVVDVNIVACSRGVITFKKPSVNKKYGKRETLVKSNTSDSNMNNEDDIEMVDDGDDVVHDKKDTVDNNIGTGKTHDCDTGSSNRMVLSSHSSSSTNDISDCLVEVNFKRKLDISDDSSLGESSESHDKPTGFKSRKVTKRNIRTRDSSE